MFFAQHVACFMPAKKSLRKPFKQRNARKALFLGLEWKSLLLYGLCHQQMSCLVQNELHCCDQANHRQVHRYLGKDLKTASRNRPPVGDSACVASYL